MTHNCYTCKNRQEVVGSAHSQCNSYRSWSIGIFNLVSHVQMGGQFEEVKFNPHGVANGWCMWPLNFDPVWIDKCDLYEELK